jgi:hypothetical protein
VTALWFLLIALAISLLGSLLLWLRNRRPSSVEHAVDEFSREMRALSPEARVQVQEQRREEGRRRGPG